MHTLTGEVEDTEQFDTQYCMLINRKSPIFGDLNITFKINESMLNFDFFRSSAECFYIFIFF